MRLPDPLSISISTGISDDPNTGGPGIPPQPLNLLLASESAGEVYLLSQLQRLNATMCIKHLALALDDRGSSDSPSSSLTCLESR